MRIGVFGGTFDPPHVGHLIVAQDAFTALRLDRLLFVPAAAPPHKRGRVHAPPALRLAMLRAAVADDPRFAIEELELQRPGPSYTVDTLRTLHTRHAGAELFFLLGADQFRELHTWREPAEIARLARPVVLSRGGVGDSDGTGGAGTGTGGVETGTGGPGRRGVAPTREVPFDLSYETLAVTRIDVSATDIRRRIAAGEPIRYLVPEAVRQIIERERLYQEP